MSGAHHQLRETTNAKGSPRSHSTMNDLRMHAETNSNHILYNVMIGPGWRGAVQILSTVPTVDWVLLGSGESNKG